MSCPNCGSERHRRCCACCGARHTWKRREHEFCSASCERKQRLADEISAEMERDEVAELHANALRAALADAIQWIADRSSDDSVFVARLRRVLAEHST